MAHSIDYIMYAYSLLLSIILVPGHIVSNILLRQLTVSSGSNLCSSSFVECTVQYFDPAHATCVITCVQTVLGAYNPTQLVINSYLQLKRHNCTCARWRRARSVAIILLNVTTLTFETLFYLTHRRWECGFIDKLVETIIV